ncbi:hypothetical protein MMC10_002078 [Thelotrema lepadinum]|nr:hypothetical protein [Thelotrema lepadinum]
MPVRIGLSGSNLERGYEYLMDVADPASPNYGRHWTPEEVSQTFAPSKAALNNTTTWLQDSGIASNRIAQAGNGGYLTFDATIDELERLLKTEYYLYQHSQTEQSVAACDQYLIPSDLKDHVDFISPGVGSPISSVARRASGSNLRKRDLPPCLPAPGPSNFTLDQCWQGVFPGCLNALYDIPQSTPFVSSNVFGIFEFNGSYIQTDMDQFFQQVASDIPVGTVANNVLLNGAPIDTKLSDNTDVAEESNLDFQLAWPLVYPQNISLYDVIPTRAQAASILQSNTTDDEKISIAINVALEDLFSSFDGSQPDNSTDTSSYVAPNVLSISYATFETEVSEAVSQRFCNEVLMLGLQGTTVVVSTGDTGMSPKNNVCAGPNGTVFEPSGIASCPYILSVGATMLSSPPNSSFPLSTSQEVAAFDAPTNFTSSGGFSNYFPAPSYQQDTLSKYFYNNPSPYPTYDYNSSDHASIGANGGRFNRLGRGIPDVSALGFNYIGVVDGCLINKGAGTSASTPVFATVIHRINNERMAAGKGPVGFINPVLYANPQVLNDVVEGRNVGCESDGFEAVSGWDPVTGLGTPNFERMRALFMELP